MRSQHSYRGARRREYRQLGNKFPWPNQNAKYTNPPPVKPNKRDWSILKVEEMAPDHTQFLKAGILWINHDAKPMAMPKPSRGWASNIRRKPLHNFLDEAELHTARLRHKWYRKLNEQQLQQLRKQDALLRST